jgi:hypothetical protein
MLLMLMVLIPAWAVTSVKPDILEMLQQGFDLASINHAHAFNLNVAMHCRDSCKINSRLGIIGSDLMPCSLGRVGSSVSSGLGMLLPV